MSNRRNFIKKVTATAGALSLSEFINPLFAEEMKSQAERVSKLSLEESVTDEDFWGWVRESYSISSTIINLNNGGVSPQPKVVQDAHIRYYQMCNDAPSYYMWRILDQGRESLRMKLADLGGCSAEEIAINRNSTEGLNSIIFGLTLKAGDEIVLNKNDYPNMINAWKQRKKRDGVKLVWVDFKKFPIENDDEIVKVYADAITSKTKIVHVTHMINWVGQVLPVKKIAKIAHEKGCEVIVDGAHTFAHFDYKIPDLDCDYYATSLHKWLCAPFGSGMMYIKKDKIKNIWALLSAPEPDGTDIRKFENLGTRSFASEMAISNAIDFHNIIGTARKSARLHYLKNYWTEKAAKIPKVSLLTSLLPPYSGALACIAIEGWKPEDIEAKLFEKKKIHCTTINWENIHGVRITPNVYTSLKELDRLLDGLKEIAVMEPLPSKTDNPVKK